MQRYGATKLTVGRVVAVLVLVAVFCLAGWQLWSAASVHAILNLRPIHLRWVPSSEPIAFWAYVTLWSVIAVGSMAAAISTGHLLLQAERAERNYPYDHGKDQDRAIRQHPDER